ncbi:metallopeptidase family protein [Oceanitalea stevensii]|uniref:Metallopeptidase family protein n=1 Tax=Oceanitalea stevensii TaxID=2763072 RepID=A0ABR8Z435_9MICO|nr:metallopeptidase family protein [Oceanitalea stevensii]MBD8063081.1 metallopeptidase family protein [Oceanitalea stevensii]
MPDDLVIPSRRSARRRDRRGRGLRGPLLPPTLPGWRTRSEEFDDAVLGAVERLEKRWSRQLSAVEFGVEEVPPSDPSPWEQDAVALGRYFPADPAAGLTDRVVLYRRPIQSRCEDATELHALVEEVVREQVAHLLGRDPDDL